MKYLENLSLETISNSLTNREIGGGLIINGRIEVYSTKKAGNDKKESKMLESKLSEGGANVKTPKKLLVDLIQTMNASMIDYDFSDISPDSFSLVNVNDAVQHINSHLSQLSSDSNYFISNMWKNILECLGVTTLVNTCEVYKLSESTVIDEEVDMVWSFNYFFCCKEMKRICYFSCSATSKFRRMNVSLSADGIASMADEEVDTGKMNYEDRDGDSGDEEYL